VKVQRGAAPFFFEPGYFLIMNALSVLCFAGLTTAAILLRKRTDWHRRLHYCGMAMLTGPGWGRLLPMPLLIPWAGWIVFAVILLFPLAGVIADLRRSGRVHPAWWYGIAAMVGTQAVTALVTYSPLGVAIYGAAVAGSPGSGIAPLVYPPSPLH
jgi:hypothetical protein